MPCSYSRVRLNVHAYHLEIIKKSPRAVFKPDPYLTDKCGGQSGIDCYTVMLCVLHLQHGMRGKLYSMHKNAKGEWLVKPATRFEDKKEMGRYTGNIISFFIKS